MENNNGVTPFEIILGLVLMLGFFVLAGSVYAENNVAKSFTLIKPVDYKTDQDLTGWVMSEKLDGIRAYWDGKQLWTKSGNKIHAPYSFIKNFPPFELDGELWIARQSFEKAASIVLDEKPSNEWNKVQYHIFEVPNQKGDLWTRLSILQDYLDENKVHNLHVINQVNIIDHKHVQKYMHELVELGAEGLIIRDARMLYQTGRQASIQKVKPKYDAECLIKGYTEGNGKYQGMVGAIVCELLENQIAQLFPKLVSNKATVIKIGSGLSDRFRNTPAKIGSVVTFQYMGLTKNGLPRFPVFLRVRPEE